MAVARKPAAIPLWLGNIPIIGRNGDFV